MWAILANFIRKIGVAALTNIAAKIAEFVYGWFNEMMRKSKRDKEQQKAEDALKDAVDKNLPREERRKVEDDFINSSKP